MRAVAAALLALASPGCARAIEPPAGGVAAPAVTRAPVCRIAGPTKLVADNVYGGQAVALARPDGGIDVVLVDQVEPCLHVGFGRDREKDGTMLGPCPDRAPLRRATSRSGAETYLAQGYVGHEGGRLVALGYVVPDWPRARFGTAFEPHVETVWHRLSGAPETDADERAPAVATFGEDGFFLVWVQDGAVRGVALSGGAWPAHSPLTLSADELDDVGQPSAAFSTAGFGLVAFTANGDAGPAAFATVVECSP